MKNTSTLFSFNPGELIKIINWVRADGKYVIVDPNNSQLLMYLDEKQYNRFCIVAISSEKPLVVLVTPDDSKETVVKRFKDPSTPLPGIDTPLKFPRLSKMFSLLDGWTVKESMIEFKRNFKQFFPTYHLDMISWLGLKRSSSLIVAIGQFGSRMDVINSSEGINQTINLLKIYSITVLQYLAGTPLNSTQDLGRRVRLKHGLPVILPSIIRHLIRQRDVNTIRVVISLLHAYKGMKGIYKAPDFSSIVAPRFVPPSLPSIMNIWKGVDDLLYPQKRASDSLDSDWSEVNSTLSSFWKDFNPKQVKPTLLSSVETLSIPLTVGPNCKVSVLGSSVDALALLSNGKMHKLITSYFKEAEQVSKLYKVSIPSKELSLIEMITKEALILKAALIKDISVIQNLVSQVSYLRPEFQTRIDSYNLISDPDLRLSFMKDLVRDIQLRLRLGKLAIKLEAAGKVRVFAISDFWTQNMMKPLHKSIFNVLEHHSSDATFNQEGRVKDFSQKGHKFIASFDLKSATDLIPIQLYEKVLGQ